MGSAQSLEVDQGQVGVGEEGERGLLETGRACWGPTEEEEGGGRVEGVRQRVLANTKEPLASHFPSAPLLSALNQYTSCFYPWLPWCLCWWVSLCVF